MDIIHGIKHTNSEQFVIFVIRSRSGEPEEITRRHGGGKQITGIIHYSCTVTARSSPFSDFVLHEFSISVSYILVVLQKVAVSTVVK